MIQFDLVQGEYVADLFSIKMSERPPMVEIEEYKNRFGDESEKKK